MLLGPAAIIGTAAGLMTDPVGWLLIIVVFAMGWRRPPISPWAPVLAAMVATAILSGRSYSWLAEAGTLDTLPQRTIANALGYFVIAIIGYGLARLIQRVRNRVAERNA